METLQNISLPVIAEVDGLVTAAATQLVGSCDIVAATKRSTFSCPGYFFAHFLGFGEPFFPLD